MPKLNDETFKAIDQSNLPYSEFIATTKSFLMKGYAVRTGLRPCFKALTSAGSVADGGEAETEGGFSAGSARALPPANAGASGPVAGPGRPAGQRRRAAAERDGSFDLDACRIAYIRYLRSEDRRGRSRRPRTAFRKPGQRKSNCAPRAKKRGLSRWKACKRCVADIIGTYRYELTASPRQSTRDLTVRGEIEKQLNDAVDRCRQRFAKLATLYALAAKSAGRRRSRRLSEWGAENRVYGPETGVPGAAIRT
jgi:hypothetical protein